MQSTYSKMYERGQLKFGKWESIFVFDCFTLEKYKMYQFLSVGL